MHVSLDDWKKATDQEWRSLQKAVDAAERQFNVIGILTLDTMFRLCRLRTYLHSDGDVPDFCYRALRESLTLTLELLEKQHGGNTGRGESTIDSASD
jgi:hypothetical protein